MTSLKDFTRVYVQCENFYKHFCNVSIFGIREERFFRIYFRYKVLLNTTNRFPKRKRGRPLEPRSSGQVINVFVQKLLKDLYSLLIVIHDVHRL